jgi:hypothetical protein
MNQRYARGLERRSLKRMANQLKSPEKIYGLHFTRGKSATPCAITAC